MQQLFLFLFLFSTYLFGYEFDSNYFAVRHNDASAIVDGCVSAITGDYLVDERVEVKGHEPISFDTRYFSTKSDQRGIFHGWFGQSRFFAKSRWYLPAHATSKKAHQYDISLTTIQNTSIPVRYRYEGRQSGENSTKPLRFSLDKVGFLKKFLEAGYTDINQMVGISKTRVSMHHKGKSFTVESLDGRVSRYKRISKFSEKLGEDTEHIYRLEEEILPNKNRVLYFYDSLQSKCLTEIQTKDPTGAHIYAWIRFHFWGKNQDVLQIETSDGQVITYSFRDDKDDLYHLSAIMGTKTPEKAFTYHSGTCLIKAKKEGDSLSHKVTYYRERTGIRKRVKTLYKTREDGSLFLDKSFTYHLGKYGQSGGHTVVVDSEGNETIYRYNAYFRLECVEYYYLEEGVQRLSYKDVFTWGEDPHVTLKNLLQLLDVSSEEKQKPIAKKSFCYLLAKSRLDGQNNCISSERFFYDEWGNVSEVREYGNITGRSKPLFLYNGLPDQSDAEYRCTKYIYSSDGKNRLCAKKTSTCKTKYFYHNDTNLLRLKIERYSNHTKRTFFFYNEENLLVRKVEDDGIGMKLSKLKGVTQRITTEISPRDEEFLYGMADIIQIFAYCFPQKKRDLVQKIQLHYDKFGHVVKKDFYDANNKHRYSEKCGYDEKGRRVRKGNALYTNLYKYDRSNRVILVEELTGKNKTRYSYNEMGKLASIEEVSENSETRKKTYGYFPSRRRSSSSDYHGNKTLYSYRRRGLLEQVTQPRIALNEKPQRLSIFRYFDCMGNLIEESYGKKLQKRCTYNKDNNPLSIEYADGSKEVFTYDVEGRLIQKKHANGSYTNYLYDGLNRVTQKAQYSPQGKVLKNYFYLYSAWHLLSSLDPDGALTQYNYDHFGRCIRVKLGEDVKTYEYDALGRMVKMQQKTSSGVFCTRYKYDLLNRVIEKYIEENYPRKRVVFREKYAYNEQNLCIEKTSFINNQPFKTTYEYDGFSRKIAERDEAGHETLYFYKTYQGPYFSGEECTMEKSSGLTVIERKNPQGLLIQSIKKGNNRVLEEDLYEYNRYGKCIFHKETVHLEGGSSKSISCRYTYNNMHLLESFTEFSGMDEERTTFYAYHPGGLLSDVLKPDGVSIRNEYDFLGNLSSISSSDGTVHYSYERDASGRVLSCRDELTGQVTQRSYDSLGNLQQEVLENGLKMQYKYDDLSRRIQSILPDGSSVLYSYDPYYLGSITRLDNYGSKEFQHQLVKYDLSGRLHREKSLFDTKYIYNSSGALARKVQEKFTQNISSRQEDFSIESLEISSIGLKSLTQFSYDPLGVPLREEGVFSRSYSDWMKKPFWQLDSSRREGHLELGKGNRSYLMYDPNGSVKSESLGSQIALYHYDALGRLTSYSVSNLFNVHYEYDGFHRRVQKTVYQGEKGYWKKVLEERFLYDGDVEIGKYENGSMTEFRLVKPAKEKPFSEMLFLEILDDRYVPMQNAFGHVNLLLSNKLQLVERSQFSLFGEEKPLQQKPFVNPWRFISARHEKEHKNLYYKGRYYSRRFGIWMTKDPKRFYEQRSTNPSSDIPNGQSDIYHRLKEEVETLPTNKRRAFHE